MSYDPQELGQLAQREGMQVGVIHCDKGVPAVLMEAMDDMGAFMEAEECGKALAAGRVQALLPAKV